MSSNPPFRKVFDRVATRQKMFELFDCGADLAPEDRISGDAFAGGWFEINQVDYRSMLDLLPPLFMRTGMFGMSEFKAGYVTSVFFGITIRGRRRWFHGYCDLSDKHSPDAMRAAIIAHETRALDSMTREEKLEAIWADTLPDFRGIAGALNPNVWAPEHCGKRTILVNAGGLGATLKLLEDLTDEEIEEKLGACKPGPAGEGGSDTG